MQSNIPTRPPEISVEGFTTETVYDFYLRQWDRNRQKLTRSIYLISFTGPPQAIFINSKGSVLVSIM